MAAHRLSVSIVLAALLATFGVFLFARPQYRDPNPGSVVSFKRYHAPAHGWTWADGQPGFRFGDNEKDWNLSEVRPEELAGARSAATRAGVDPSSVLPLHAVRLAPHELYALVAGTDVHGGTCLGAMLPQRPVRYFCGPQLRDHVGIVVVAARPPETSRIARRRLTAFPLFLMGATRADVSKVLVSAPGLRPVSFYDRDGGWWGTFDGTPGDAYSSNRVPKHPWGARLDFVGDHGRVATLPVRLDRPTPQVFAVAAP